MRKAAKKVNFNATYQWCAGGAMWKLNHQHVKHNVNNLPKQCLYSLTLSALYGFKKRLLVAIYRFLTP